MKTEKSISANIHKNDVSQKFYQEILELSATLPNNLTRLPSDAISSLIDTAECFPEPYIRNVFNDVKTSVSGDVYLSRLEYEGDDNLVLLAVREGEINRLGHKECRMKTDTFVIKVDADDTINKNMYACYHLDCTGRYTEPCIYETLRNSLSVGQTYDCNDSKISSLMNPIREGVKETDKFISLLK